MISRAPFGSWRSPITAESIAESSVKLSEIKVDESGTRVLWIEGRASEGGRSAIVGLESTSLIGNSPCDFVPRELNSRTRVHEYGGGSYCAVGSTGDVITCDYSNQDLKLIRGGAFGSSFDLVKNSTKAQYRYADFIIDPIAARGDERLLFAVREDHTIDEPSKVVNTIVSFPVLNTNENKPIFSDPTEQVVLVNGSGDPNIMMSNPRIDPTGQFLCWVQWAHPNMPWDDTTLFVAKLSTNGRALDCGPVAIAGGIGESVMEPKWVVPTDPLEASRGVYLFYLSDKTEGWWNIHRAMIPFDAASGAVIEGTCVLQCIGREFGAPAWVFGYEHYHFLPGGSDVLTFWTDGTGTSCAIRFKANGKFVIDKTQSLEEVNASTSSDELSVIRLPWDTKLEVQSSTVDALGNVFFIGGGPCTPSAVFKWSLPFSGAGSRELSVIRPSMTLTMDESFMSIPQYIEFPTVCNGADCISHGIFYPPTNPNYKAADDNSRPPLLVKLHGGPTGKAVTTCRLDIQFFTSRGFAVLDVDYSGSSGYGREYRKRLDRNWGAADVEDCCRGAAYLGEKGLVDGTKLAIQGGSAGGYTALASVAFRNVFSAATSSYGIGDLEALLSDTHKFESRYMDNLVGPYPESKAVYESRCPVKYVEDVRCPILFLHGKEDPVCPPNQATEMYGKLVAKGVPTCMILFDGESHGWRKAETIRTALIAELNFYGRVFGFTPDDVMPLDIVGLTASGAATS